MEESKIRSWVLPLPQCLQFGDEVVFKGKIKDEAKDMSINFVAATSCSEKALCSEKVVYQLQWKDGKVYQNWKRNNEWVMDKYPEDDSDKRFTDLKGFHLRFFFDDEQILVNDEETNSHLYVFPYNIPLSQITSIQVWNDIEKVYQIKIGR